MYLKFRLPAPLGSILLEELVSQHGVEGETCNVCEAFIVSVVKQMGQS